MAPHIDLADQWRAAHADLGIEPDLGVFQQVVEHWNGEGRFYHAIAHLEHGLRALADAGPEAALVRLVWFFHDVIYVVGRADNEARSADWFVSYARGRGLDEASAERGRELILFTRDHQGAVTDDPLWPLLNDVDLGVLVAAPHAYERYAQDVWREYAAVATRERYVLGRTAFLTAMRARPIFLTPAMRALEPRALGNIDVELRMLTAEAAREGWVRNG
jgi:predicted metal-dependent HD superfamily phosphohydrolase